MRKIFCHSQSLLDVYYKDFVRDTDKFFRASKLELKHMEIAFEHKGSTWKIIGQLDDRDMICRNVENDSIWAIDRQVVQKCILGETNVQFNKPERRLRPMTAEDKK